MRRTLDREPDLHFLRHGAEDSCKGTPIFTVVADVGLNDVSEPGGLEVQTSDHSI
jgi:hypothetical protein